MTFPTIQPHRLYHFLLRQISLSLQPLSTSIIATFGILLLISFAVAQFNPSGLPSLVSLYLFVLFLSGFIFTSRILSELNSPQKSYAFLTLPASTLEKLIGSWLLSSPIFLVIYMLLTSFIFWLSLAQAGTTYLFAELFDQELFQSIGLYLILQTIFFLGAATFRSNNFFKTLLSLFVLFTSLGIFSLIVFYLFFKGEFYGEGEFSVGFSTLGNTLTHQVLAFLIRFVLPPFLLVVSYFKLKERQV